MLSRRRRSRQAPGEIEQIPHRLYARTARATTTLNYLILLDRIHQCLAPRSYMEIGVARGRSMTLALPGTVCVGIDLKPNIQFPLPPTSKIYALTSDDFFEQVDVVEALGHCAGFGFHRWNALFRSRAARLHETWRGLPGRTPPFSFTTVCHRTRSPRLGRGRSHFGPAMYGR